MGDLFSNLGLGFSVALTFQNLGLAFLGCLVGTLIGVLPGVGPIATIAMLLPITFGLDPVGALIMLAGIYYGAQYGGSTTAILVNIPGEATSVVTTLDGHQMARQGRAGVALGIAAIGSFFAGVLARGSILKAIAMILLGILLSTVGTDLETGQERMTFGLNFLSDGVDFAVLAMGLFGIAEILRNLDHTETRDVVRQAIGRLLPNLQDFKDAALPILRGTAIGGALGILPGNGAVLGPFAAYTVEKRIAKDPRRFGRGAIEGVAGPEAANNAGAQTSFIPLLTLGIPPNAVMALMVGAMTIHGIVPGPQIMREQPQLVWGVIASMWVGNLMLLVINLPLIGVWVSMLKIPYRMLFPAIVLFCCIGTFGIANNLFNVWLMMGCALIGYFFIKIGVEPAPLLLGLVLGPQLEEYFRRAMLLADGDFSVFLRRPISATLLAIVAILFLLMVFPAIRRSRKE